MYQQVDAATENIIVIKRSKFITNLIPVECQEDAEVRLAIIRKKYSDATHNCFAYIADDRGVLSRFSDDGEPQGTAGLPMLELLKKTNISKTLAVVTRYFGGIKLGASGLVGAYAESVSRAIGSAIIKQFNLSQIFEIIVDYSVVKSVSECIIKHSAKIIATAYSQDIVISAAVDIDNYEQLKEKLIDLTRGQLTIKLLDKRYVSY